LQGIVIKSTGSWHTVRQENGSKTDCKIKGTFRIRGIESTNPIAVGDKVVFDINNDKTGLITDILKRKNYIIRKATKLSKRSHIIAANIDWAFLMVALAQPKTTTLFMDRFLVMAEAYHIPVNIIFNKMDIYGEEIISEVNKLIDIYTRVGYMCYKTSALKKQNIDVIMGLMKNKVSLICGNSGVGKSTLINAIDPALKLKVGNISSYHQTGTHTTTHAEMLELPSSGYIIDTPGLKSFGVYDLKKEELSHRFPEMRILLDDCKFHNCQHINEPNCAVIEALKKGKIAELRYRNYLDIYNSEEGEVFRK